MVAPDILSTYPLGRDPGHLKGHDLPIEVLLGGRDPRVPEIHVPSPPWILDALNHSRQGVVMGCLPWARLAR